MLKLARAPNVLIAQHWMNILAAAGVPCELHNRYLSGAMGEIPADQCAPEIWLTDERDETLARKLIADATNGPPPGAPSWRCPQCGETLEAQFTVCWQCGHERDPRDE
ncbi:hypothetical protein LMG28688_07052 [Paraburkholderia caffeinitolerans]|uniref:Uncharacterized protein n=1 Tax=Paraburkholderia caffeinitolerans TaxID=1723730 RepID=A0A6J5H6C2_9BURK|nr:MULTISPECIES: DUF2007 domain-containing protein [Paraburkholderia]CAB3809734.1 hypothetical protein LMG28688_07052 [Paraburkholderia caffeinitolerans]